LLAENQLLIGDVRGKGMMIGVEFVTDRETKAPANEQTLRLVGLMKDERVLVSGGGPKNTLKVRPNFAWEREHVDLFIAALDRCISSL
jgi:4-aminobutyrate aminotransferase-like enzyme